MNRILLTRIDSSQLTTQKWHLIHETFETLTTQVVIVNNMLSLSLLFSRCRDEKLSSFRLLKYYLFILIFNLLLHFTQLFFFHFVTCFSHSTFCKKCKCKPMQNDIQSERATIQRTCLAIHTICLGVICPCQLDQPNQPASQPTTYTFILTFSLKHSYLREDRTQVLYQA